MARLMPGPLDGVTLNAAERERAVEMAGVLVHLPSRVRQVMGAALKREVRRLEDLAPYAHLDGEAARVAELAAALVALFALDMAHATATLI